ncbi:uncharacterized protein LOC119532554 [Choloepus didactylus]|uniref:uncharacterized protein LOC119532554 n=1 Tax=Choloepus didactylus TaxID=27675 RepID=UPI00189CCE5F|nr:uncharacterized protein LOC119532554 [Choloepus didactylus]
MRVPGMGQNPGGEPAAPESDSPDPCRWQKPHSPGKTAPMPGGPAVTWVGGHKPCPHPLWVPRASQQGWGPGEADEPLPGPLVPMGLLCGGGYDGDTPTLAQVPARTPGTAHGVCQPLAHVLLNPHPKACSPTRGPCSCPVQLPSATFCLHLQHPKNNALGLFHGFPSRSCSHRHTLPSGSTVRSDIRRHTGRCPGCTFLSSVFLKSLITSSPGAGPLGSWAQPPRSTRPRPRAGAGQVPPGQPPPVSPGGAPCMPHKPSQECLRPLGCP